MNVGSRQGRVIAVLGPTNTGKTHLAIERMLGHRTGMIGFPLRLLARENYDRVVRIKGRAAVALITGEERILPPAARWFICTVEAMPLDRNPEFLAIDEIQLCGDAERGHIFTDRLLHARGVSETMFLGSDTMRPLIRRLVRDVEFVDRPRFSTLHYTGPKKLTRLPRRSAVVAFSAAEVYGFAELMRRQRGGCAVVLGALSPRARNAQVELYQSGEVDWLVATDAIGMGLNMDLDHVAFARLAKFDGRAPRRLTASEIAQIAGRAGRHMNDGSFGTTQEVGPLDADLVEAVENHRFDPLTQIWWRSSGLDFRSVAALQRSLEAPPPRAELQRKRDAEDHRSLQGLVRNEAILERAQGREAVRLLWDVCQVPDFTKMMSDSHLRLLGQLFTNLTGPGGSLPTDWVAAQVARLDRTDGDIDQLSARIAHVRTWTYVSHRPDWLADSAAWQERTRVIEDKLSDALHERLTQRFVDRRGMFLGKRLAEDDELLAGVAADGEVVVEGHPVGHLEGFRFAPDPSETGEGARRLMTAARRALAQEIGRRVRLLTEAPDDAFTLAPDGQILWRDSPVAMLTPGPGPLVPTVRVLPAELLGPPDQQRIHRHLVPWLRRRIEQALPALFALSAAELSGAARGIAFQLVQALGALPVAEVTAQLATLSGAERKALGRQGVRFGTETIYLEPLLAAPAVVMRALLSAVFRKLEPPSFKGGVPPSLVAQPGYDAGFYAAIGYRLLGQRAIRVDRLEVLAQALRALARQGPFLLPDSLARPLGCPPGDLPGLLEGLGYRARWSAPVATPEVPAQPAPPTWTARRRAQAKPRPLVKTDPDSPFAKLGQHSLARRSS